VNAPTIAFPSERQLVSLSACGIVGLMFMFYIHGRVLDGCGSPFGHDYQRLFELEPE
jgi:hypothetical protein